MTTTETDTDTTTDLDSLDTSMDKVYGHLPPWQQGATTIAEMLALPLITAPCGYVYKPTRKLPDNTPLTCPKCKSIVGW